MSRENSGEHYINAVRYRDGTGDASYNPIARGETPDEALRNAQERADEIICKGLSLGRRYEIRFGPVEQQRRYEPMLELEMSVSIREE